MDDLDLLAAAAIAKRDKLRAELEDAWKHENKALADAKKEKSHLPPNYWEERHKLERRYLRAEELVQSLKKDV